MAVIVSDSNNASYDTFLATASGFYRAEAYNLGLNSPTVVALSTARYISSTFANAGNCQGIVLGMYATSTSLTPYSVRAELELIKGAVTMTIASPCVVTLTGHGFLGGEEVSITTSGALPTGLTVGVKYYVKYINANTFNLSLTSGGTNINTSGTQSGTHTLGVQVASKELTSSQINPEYIYNTAMGTSGTNYFGGIVPFKFTTPYAVDTTASKWRFRIREGIAEGTTTIWSLITSDGTNPSYVAWCDNQVTATNGDVLVVVDKCIINTSFTTGAILGTGDTTVGVAGWVCRSSDISEANVCLLEWENPASSSYTLTLGGNIHFGKWSGLRIGTLASPIANAQQAKITCTLLPVAGTSRPGIMQIVGNVALRSRSGASLFLYGEIPTKPYGVLNAQANSGQAKFVTTEDLSAIWGVNDYVYVGKQDVKGQGTLVWQQIQSFSGTEITLTSNLLTNNRKAGAIVLNRDRGWGINIYGYANTNLLNITFDQPRHLEISGCVISDATVSLFVGSSYYEYPLLPANRKAQFIQDNLFHMTGNTAFVSIPTTFSPPLGLIIQRNYGFRTTLGATCYALYSKLLTVMPFASGILQFKNNFILNSYSSSLSSVVSSPGLKIEVEDNIWQNASTSRFAVVGGYITFKRNKLYGSSTPYNSSGNVVFYNSINADLQDNEFDNNGNAYTIYPSGFVLGAVSKNDKFGVEQANTYDFGHQATGYVDFTMKNFQTSAGSLTIDPTTDNTLMLSVSKIKIVSEDETANRDTVYTPSGTFYRCGYGLSDTEVWNGTAWATASADQFSLKFEPIISSGLDLIYKDNKGATIIGNCQNLPLQVSARIKINNANYYAGTHTNPTLRVTYDDGATTVSSVATDSTSGQLLLVSFVPTTTSQFIKIEILGLTDATGTDAQFKLGELVVSKPDGVLVDTTRMGGWSDAELLGTGRTFPANASIWDELTANHQVAGTTGKKLSDGTVVSDLDPLM